MFRRPPNKSCVPQLVLVTLIVVICSSLTRHEPEACRNKVTLSPAVGQRPGPKRTTELTHMPARTPPANFLLVLILD